MRPLTIVASTALLLLACEASEGPTDNFCWGDQECAEGNLCVLHTCSPTEGEPRPVSITKNADHYLVEGSFRVEGSRHHVEGPKTLPLGAHTIHTDNGPLTLGSLQDAPQGTPTSSGILKMGELSLPISIQTRGEDLLVDTPLFGGLAIATPVEGGWRWSRGVDLGPLSSEIAIVIHGDLETATVWWDHHTDSPMGEEGALSLTTTFEDTWKGPYIPSGSLPAPTSDWHPVWQWSIDHGTTMHCDLGVMTCDDILDTEACALEIAQQGYALPEVLRRDLPWTWGECLGGERIEGRVCWSRENFDCAESVLAYTGRDDEDTLIASITPILEMEVEGLTILSRAALAESAMAFREAGLHASEQEQGILEDALEDLDGVFARVLSQRGRTLFDPMLLWDLVRVDAEVRRHTDTLDASTRWLWGSYLHTYYMSWGLEEEADTLARLVPNLYPRTRQERPPRFLSVTDIEKGLTNTDLLEAATKEQLLVYASVLENAVAAFDTMALKDHDIDTARHEIEKAYTSKLIRLCGATYADAPDIEHCGSSTGDIAQLAAERDAAAARVAKANIQAQLNLFAINVEEDRIRMIVDMWAGIQASISELQGAMFQVVDQYGKKREAVRIAAAERECIRQHQVSMSDLETVDTSCQLEMQGQMKSVLVLGFAVPDIPGLILTKQKCDSQREQIQHQAAIQCGAVKDQAGVQNTMDELNRLEQSKLMVLNQEVDALLRSGNLSEQVINSASTVATMTSQILWHEKNSEEARIEAKARSIAWSSALLEVGHLLAERAETLAQIVEENPSSPQTHARFLWSQYALGRRVQGARERVTQSFQWWISSLEDDLGTALPLIRSDLEEARRVEDYQSLAGCLQHISLQHQIERGAAQTYVAEISVRRDLWGILSPVEGPSGPISVHDQFQDRIHSPEYWDGDVLSIPIPVDAGVFGGSLCDSRVSLVSVDLVGGDLGDLEASSMLSHSGESETTACGGDPVRESVMPWRLVTSTSINGETLQPPSSGFAGWPLFTTGWTWSLDTMAPLNRDVDIESLDDVKVLVHYTARTLQETPAPLTYTCD